MKKGWINEEIKKVENLNRDKLLQEYKQLLQHYTILAEELEDMSKIFNPPVIRKREGKEL